MSSTHSFLSLLMSGFFALTGLALGNESRFFARHVHPLTITDDGSRLLAVNSAESRLSVFAIADDPTSRPLLIDEIPVGLLPVSVRLRTNDEAWVVNELSDSISIVSLSQRTVIATIQTGDEPADLAFIGTKAFLTCSRDNSIEVFDATTRVRIDTIPLRGIMPRPLAVSPDGTTLYTAFLHTSNGTTILPRTEAPPQAIPANFNPALPDPPQVSQIVPVDHPTIDYTVLDHDLAIIDPVDHSVSSYRGGLGTNLHSLTALANGDLLAGNSEARNLIALEPELKARFTTSRLARLTSETHQQIELNPDPDLTFPEIDASAADTALTQVMQILPDPDQAYAWLAAFGSDRIARLDLATNTVTSYLDLRSLDHSETPRTSLTVRGPRGLALHPTQERLFVLNRLSHTLTTIDTENLTLLAETPLASHPDLDPDLKLGRAFLFDTRLSSNGLVSCASCHIDLDRDGMAWDLGNPTGEMLTIPGALLSVHAPDTFVDRDLHPMKGPMMTQTLIGLSDQNKLHWRGDKSDIQSFNSTFPNLLAAAELPDADMDLVADYLLQLKHHPNPHLKLDRSFPDEVAAGNPNKGIAVFTLFDNHCAACHHLPSGTSNNLDIPSTVGSFQALKDAPLRTTYQRTHFDPTPGGTSLSGFGLGSDGSHHELPISHPYSLHILDNINRPAEVRAQEKKDLTAFILAFDTGTAPAIGHSLTISGDTPPDAEQRDLLVTLEEQSALGELGGVALIARGIYHSTPRAFLFDSESQTYQASHSDLAGQTTSGLLDSLQAGDHLTFMGIPLEEAERIIDRDLNELPDDQDVTPALIVNGPGALSWPANSSGWSPESSATLRDWTPLPFPVETEDNSHKLSDPRVLSQMFYRLRRTW